MVDVTDAAFIALTVVTVGGAISALEAKEIIYGAVGLAASFFGVASLFFLLDSPFVAVFQITVYVGAVAVLVLFTVMLVREGRWFGDSMGPAASFAALLTVVALVFSLVTSFFAAGLSSTSEQATAPSFLGIGQLLTGHYAPVFEVLALVLAASVLGALTLAKVDPPGGGEAVAKAEGADRKEMTEGK
ncbi:MAG TPA: NADH-quinone oxidoreductase subunit J [Nitrososphaerales archaeon]|nr:NADH-quinone oxidoreductase subunit J [Nitrososphaerales archaeon]